MKTYLTSKELLESGFLEHYYDINVYKMFEYIISNKKKMQSGMYANKDCVNYIIPSSLRKMFQVTHREIDIPIIFAVESNLVEEEKL